VVHDLTVHGLLRRIGEGPKGGGDLEEYADAHVGKTLLDLGRRSARGGGDHRDERSADGVAHVHVEGQRQQRHEYGASAQSGRAPKNPEASEPSHISPENSKICMDNNLHVC
jgi:hypothetical protein